MDFDEKSVRVARCLNLIAGDGQTNVIHLNTKTSVLFCQKWNDDPEAGPLCPKPKALTFLNR